MKKSNKTPISLALSIILSMAPTALGGNSKADFLYYKASFLGTNEPIAIRVVYDYGERTYIKVAEHERPNRYNNSEGRALGAYACQNNTIHHIPLEVSGGYYVAKGMFTSLYLYRRRADVWTRPTELPGELMEGVIRLDYVGRNGTRFRIGKDDCLAILRDRFIEAESGGGPVMVSQTTLNRSIEDEARAGVVNAADRLTRRPRGYASPPPKEAVILKEEEYSVPFYVARSGLGPKGAAAIKALADILLSDEEGRIRDIIITSYPDTAAAQDYLIGRVIDEEEAPPVFPPEKDLVAARNAALYTALVVAGVPSKLIRYGGIPNDPNPSKSIPYAANAVIKVLSREGGENREPLKPLVAERQVAEYGIEGEQYDDEQIMTKTEEPTTLLVPALRNIGGGTGGGQRDNIISHEEIKPVPPPVSAEVARLEQLAEMNIFRAGEGQLLSDAVAAFLRKNGYQMVWKVSDGRDWKITSKVSITGAHLTDTLHRVLDNFPVVAVMDPSQAGRFVQILLKNNYNSAASNPVPTGDQQ